MSERTKKSAVAVPRADVIADFAQHDDARPEASRLADDLAFLRGFLARPMQVASVVPSSVFLEQRVVRAAGLSNARCVVELGPGTGGTTRALLRALMPHARLLAIELNPYFCARLRRRIRDARLAVQEGSAEALADHLADRGLPAPDAIISGIPFSTLPAEAAQRIAAAIHATLAPGGRFVAYQLRAHVAGYATPHLGAPAVAWEWRNVPPMRVFRWVKPGIQRAA
jgi:phospholipid N-methyltransferase